MFKRIRGLALVATVAALTIAATATQAAAAVSRVIHDM